MQNTKASRCVAQNADGASAAQSSRLKGASSAALARATSNTSEQRNQHSPPRDEAYLHFIRNQPCCICGGIDVEAHHVRIGSLEHGSNPGGAQRSEDRWALPLCNRHHREAHRGEREFWASLGIDPFQLCLKFQVMVR
jgi:hypothetical protein